QKRNHKYPFSSIHFLTTLLAPERSPALSDANLPRRTKSPGNDGSSKCRCSNKERAALSLTNESSSLRASSKALILSLHLKCFKASAAAHRPPRSSPKTELNTFWNRLRFVPRKTEIM